MEIVKTWNKKEFGFKFTDKTIIMYCQARGIDLSEFDKTLSDNVLEATETMFLCAYKCYHKGTKELTDYELDDFLNGISDEDYIEIYQCFTDSIIGTVNRLIRPSTGEKKK